MTRFSEFDPGGRDLDRLREGDTLGSGSFRNDGNDDDDGTYFSYRDAEARAEGRRELPPVRRAPVPSMYDAFQQLDDAPYLTEQQLLDLIRDRAIEHAQGNPERAAALNRVAAKIAQRQAEFDAMSHIDQVDAWGQLMEHETAPARRRDGLIDGFSMEQQALAAAGRGSLDLSQHPETRLRGRDLRAELDAEKSGQRRDQ